MDNVGDEGIFILRDLHILQGQILVFWNFGLPYYLLRFWFCVLATQWQLIYEAEVTWTFVLQREKLSMYDNVISGWGFFFSPEDKSFLFPLLLFVIFLQASEEKEGKMKNHKIKQNNNAQWVQNIYLVTFHFFIPI